MTQRENTYVCMYYAEVFVSKTKCRGGSNTSKGSVNFVKK